MIEMLRIDVARGIKFHKFYAWDLMVKNKL